MNEWKEPCNTDRENRHGFGGPGNGISPARPEQVQYGGDQGPRMRDSHPENEIDQIGPPGHRIVHSGHADACQDLIYPAGRTSQRPQKEDSNGHPVAAIRWFQGVQHDLVDFCKC